MKTRLALSLFVLAGCSSSPTTQCQPSIMCGMDTVQVCCTTTQCQYQVSGMTFPCAGTDCNAASMQVRALCPDTGVMPTDAAIDTGPDAAIDADLDASVDAAVDSGTDAGL